MLLRDKGMLFHPFGHKVRGICCQNTSIPRWPYAQQVRGWSSEEASFDICESSNFTISVPFAGFGIAGAVLLKIL